METPLDLVMADNEIFSRKLAHGFSTLCILRYLRSLKELTYETNKAVHGSEHNQAMMAVIVSRRELEEQIVDCLDEWKRAFDPPVLRKRKREIKCLRKADRENEQLKRLTCLHDKRVVYLRNEGSSGVHSHTEGRLLDPAGDLRRKIDPKEASPVIEDRDVLHEMKQEFTKEFGNEDFYLLIFTHHIPCLKPGHRCSVLLKRFAEFVNYPICIGYGGVPSETSLSDVERVLEQSERITFFKLGYPHSSSHDRNPPFIKWNAL